MKNKLVGIVGGAAAGLVVIGSALAAPSGKNSDTIALDCDDGNTYNVIVNGGGMSPGHVVDTNQKFIPVEISFQGTFVDADGNVHEFEDTQAKGNAPRSKSLISCEFSQSFSDPETGESAEIEGHVIGFLNR